MTASEPGTAVPGRFRLLDAGGVQVEVADATFQTDPEALLVAPRQQPVLRVDFAEVDELRLGDYVLTLRLASGEQVEASMLGRRHVETVAAVGAALTAYQAKNLLLAEPVGGEPFACDVARQGNELFGEVRLYATSVAVLPRGAVPYGIPLGEVFAVTFDEGRYAIDLETPDGRVSLLRLGKRTQPCLRLLESRLTELRGRTSAALAFLVPGLPPLVARRVAQALADGVPAHRAQLDAISAEVWPRLVAAGCGEERLAQSVAALTARCPPGEVAVGIKETNARQDADEPEPAAEGEGATPPAEPAAEGEGATPPAEPEGEPNPMTGRVVWFACPIYAEDRSLPGNAVAVEAVSRGGRATYLFRIAPAPVYAQLGYAELRRLARERVRSVSRALVALTFKREPIYLSDEKLQTGPYSRYRLALRLSEPLKTSRASFVGRAVHGPGWATQVDAALTRALTD